MVVFAQCEGRWLVIVGVRYQHAVATEQTLVRRGFLAGCLDSSHLCVVWQTAGGRLPATDGAAWLLFPAHVAVFVQQAV